MKYITAALLVLAMNHALAEEIVINWELATEREDGTPLDISEISGTNLWSKVNDGDVDGPVLIPRFITSLDFTTDENLSCMKRSTVLFNGQESEQTEWFCVTNTPMEGE